MNKIKIHSKIINGKNVNILKGHGVPLMRMMSLSLWLSIWLVLWVPLTVLGNPTDLASEDAVKQIMDTQEALSRIDRRIERENFLAAQKAYEEQAVHEQLIARLQEIKFIHQRVLNTLKKNITIASEEVEVRKAIDSGRAYSLAEQKPYSLSYYDELLDAVSAEQQTKETLAASIRNAQLKLDEKKHDLDKALRTWRRIKEEVESTKGESAAGDLKYNRSQLEKEAVEISLDLQTARIAGLNGQMRLVKLREHAAQQKLALIKKDLSFDPKAIDMETTRLEKQRVDINTRLKAILDDQRELELEWRADRTKSGSSANELVLKSREAWQTAYETALGQTEDMVHLINTQKKLWRYRYALVTYDVAVTDMDRWEKEASTARKHAQQATGLYQRWQVDLRSRKAALEKKLKTADQISKKYITHHLGALNRSGDFGGAYFSSLVATGKLANRLLEESTNGHQRTLLDRLVNSRSKVNEIWNFELWVIDEQGVTVKKVITALVILIIGIIVVRRVIKSLAKRLNRAKFEAGAVAGAEKILLYSGFVLVVLFALRIVNIPLTAFTFLGGAIAIGLGFGAQNLINNFISGFIIMAERPIRIGDLIELEGKCVRVEEIGARCTKVKTVENIHILVPNSSFLEKNITNWTLSDKMIRTRLAVGVAYGSNVKKVTELLMVAANQTEPILKTPQPFVIFEDFGDSVLVFEVHYWLKVGGMIERNQIASALRYHIYEQFNTHGIVIAFPQQDIHLNAKDPLQVQLSAPARQAKLLNPDKPVKSRINRNTVTAKLNTNRRDHEPKRP